MKTSFFKAFVLTTFFFIAPFLSPAQELPPDNGVDSSLTSWLLILLGTGAVYGAIKMWKQSSR